MVISELGFSYAFINSDSAIYYFTKGLDLANSIDYMRGKESCMNGLALSFSVSADYSNALKVGFDLIDLAKALKDSVYLTYGYEEILICYFLQNDYKEALKYGYIEKPIYSRLKPKLRGSNLLGMLGQVHEKDNNLDSAVYYLDMAFQNPAYQKWPGGYLSYGNVYAKKKNYPLAFSYYRKGIKLASEQGVYIDLIDIYNNISGIYETVGKYDSSIYYAQRSIFLNGFRTYPNGILRAAKQILKLYELKGRQDSVVKYQRLVINLQDSLFNQNKTRDAHSIGFNKKFQAQELMASEQQHQSKIRTNTLMGSLFTLSVIALFLYRSSQQKQKAKQKIERAYDQLKSTQSQLIQSEKMASLGELTAGIAHEIQNPLNFVNNFSEVNTELIGELKVEMLKVNSERNEKLEDDLLNDISQNLEKINHHGKRADAIVKGMLQHSRSSSGVKEPTDINALADEYLRLAYHGLRAKDKSFNATMKTDFDETIGNINIIPQDIGRVILNLITNAFYAVAEKSSFAKALEDKQYEPTVSVSTKRVGDKILISVKDNGNGIPEKVLDKIFQPFFTTKPTGQGTGLGLSLSYDIVKAHNGELKVETKEGTGTTFIITL